MKAGQRAGRENSGLPLVQAAWNNLEVLLLPLGARHRKLCLLDVGRAEDTLREARVDHAVNVE